MRKISYEQYLDKVYGCYIGKAISGNIGAPLEGVKMAMELPFMSQMINPDMPNDDLDLQVLWLDVLDQKGADFTSYDLLKQFVLNCDYSPGEYAVMRKNFKKGIYPPYSGSFCNDYYTEGMGCPIRSEIWGSVAVGNPELAMEFASRDGCLDHCGESIEAEKFLAALESEAFFESDIKVLINSALQRLPVSSKFRHLVEFTVSLCERFDDITIVLGHVLKRYGHPDCTNMYQNMGIVIASLLLGDSDVIKTSMMALNCGFDTDCTCATAGAVIGIIRGADELIKAYGLKKITYSLGVKSNRKSDLISELAKDIAKIGVGFSESVNRKVTITNAPQYCKTASVVKGLTVSVDYEGLPSISLDDTRCVTLSLKNNTAADAKLNCEIITVNGIKVDKPRFVCLVPANGLEKVKLEFSLPIDTEFVSDVNILQFTAQNELGETVLEKNFGLSGAVPWKLSGPFWRTEPEVDTQKIIDHYTEYRLPYKVLIFESKFEGSYIDQLRHFHLNFATDTEKEYASDSELFKRLSSDPLSAEYQHCLFNSHEDALIFDDMFGFKGPSVAYLSRIINAEEDMDVFVMVGHSAPFSLYLNGELIAKKGYCDNWTAENQHLDNIKLKKGDNHLVFRLTRVNSDAKFNVTFTKGINCAEHIVGLKSKNPYFW